MGDEARDIRQENALALRVKGMTCHHCRLAVERAISKVPGVRDVKVDLAAGTVRVTFEPGRADRDAVVRAIEEEGYTVSP
ncbi:MAG: cation transporter [Bacillota bacterium]